MLTSFALGRTPTVLASSGLQALPGQSSSRDQRRWFFQSRWSIWRSGLCCEAWPSRSHLESWLWASSKSLRARHPWDAETEDQTIWRIFWGKTSHPRRWPFSSLDWDTSYQTGIHWSNQKFWEASCVVCEEEFSSSSFLGTCCWKQRGLSQTLQSCCASAAKYPLWEAAAASKGHVGSSEFLKFCLQPRSISGDLWISRRARFDCNWGFLSLAMQSASPHSLSDAGSAANLACLPSLPHSAANQSLQCFCPWPSSLR